MNNPFEYTPDAECAAAFIALLALIDRLRASDDQADINLCRALDDGKMLGVLIAADQAGIHHTLYAFSGQLGTDGLHHRAFVGPAFDYLQPDGYYKTREAAISTLNADISHYEQEVLAATRHEYLMAKARCEAMIEESRRQYRASKAARDAQREAGCSPAETAELIRQSQHEKAELHRLKKHAVAELAPYAERFENAQACLNAMKERRRADSEALQQWLFDHFTLLNARGESCSLSRIFADTPTKVPPTGAGECCAPKLLQAAYIRGWKPLSMAEYWHGRSKDGEVRIHGEHYPSCRGKCLPILHWMLQGLDVNPPLNTDSNAERQYEPTIVYENQWFCVVDKPSGMLSVPGKGAAISVLEWLTSRYQGSSTVKMVHRLDQDTSGLLIAAFDESAYVALQRMFAKRQVSKTYIAVLNGDYRMLGLPQSGVIDLPLSPDPHDRPRQRIDHIHGKEALTEYKFIDSSDGQSRIIFHPRSGRTHQLRIHSASESGLGMPIAGDRLYGKNGGKDTPRLMLHAHKIEFDFPINGQHYAFTSPEPF